MQSGPIALPEKRGVNTSITLLPQYLAKLGYRRHAVGKWHLGFYKDALLPHKRGFESHLGPYQGYAGYYDYIGQVKSPDGKFYNGYDMRLNGKTRWDLQGEYITRLFTKRAKGLIENHDTKDPLFLYLAYTAPHGSHPDMRVEAPWSTVANLSKILLPQRRNYAGMIAELDRSVGEVVKSLEKKGILDNTIILFFGDNGAPAPNALFPNYGSNYPLLGGKYTLYDGGVRTPGFIWSKELQKNARVSHELLHVTDWLPTLYEAAGGKLSDLPKGLSGTSQWSSLTTNTQSQRTQVVLNVWSTEGTAAIISKTEDKNTGKLQLWKLYNGTTEGGKYDQIIGPYTSYSPKAQYNTEAVILSPANRAIKGTVDSAKSSKALAGTRVDCGKNVSPSTVPHHDCKAHPCLFNLDEDPCEKVNLAGKKEYADLVKTLYHDLLDLSKKEVKEPPLIMDFEKSDPCRFNNTWAPWLNTL